MTAQLADLQKAGDDALEAYIRNVRLSLYTRSEQVILEAK